MYWKPIDKSGVTLYKGLAILMIVTHNFMHVFPLPRQNEFNFKREYFDSFLSLMWNQPENSFRFVASYFGHFGVQIFIFLSAYGLTKKYLNKTIIYTEFLKQRLLKIYPAFLLALITWFAFRIVWYYLNGTLATADFMIDAVLLKIFLVSNFFSDYALKPVGPWWFFPFIIQFYILYPVLLSLFKKWNVMFLICISCFSFAIVFIFKDLNYSFFYNILPYIPGFCLGIYIAKYEYKSLYISNVIFTMILIVFILGNLYKSFWYLNHFCALIILLWFFQIVKKQIEKIKSLNTSVLFFGIISMQVFFVHGFLRTPLTNWAMENETWYMVIFYYLNYLLLTTLVALVLFKIEHHLRQAYSIKHSNKF